MYSRLTTEGRAVRWFACKVLAWGSAITLGTTGVVTAGESIGRPIAAWCHHVAFFSPSGTVVAAPLVYRSSYVAPSPAPVIPQFHFQPLPAQQSYPVRTYPPTYISANRPGPGTVRMMTSGYRPRQSSQQRYFRYPTNFQSGYHPNSYPPADPGGNSP
jgi:hypothetical protein